MNALEQRSHCIIFDFVYLGVSYSGENDVCGVTLVFIFTPSNFKKRPRQESNLQPLESGLRSLHWHSKYRMFDSHHIYLSIYVDFWGRLFQMDYQKFQRKFVRSLFISLEVFGSFGFKVVELTDV